MQIGNVKMTDDLWLASHRLAARLAQRGVDDNLLKTAAAVMKAYPEASFYEWLDRLVQLGEAFVSSDRTREYRQGLWEECYRLEPEPPTGTAWGFVLAWAGRLYTFYERNSDARRAMAYTSQRELPPMPNEW